MISFNWSVSIWSIWAMRLLIIATVSSPTAMEESSTCETNSPMRSRACGRCSSSRAIRPFTMMVSSRLTSAAPPPCACVSGCLSSFFAIAVTSRRGFDLLHAVGVLHHVLQQGVERVVAVELGEEVCESRARLEELPQRLNLLEDVDRAEVVEIRERQLDVHLLAIARKAVVRAQGEARADGLHDVVEVVAVYLDVLALLQRRQRLCRLARQVGHDADDEGQLLHHDCVAYLHVVCDLNAWGSDAVEFVLCAFWHYRLLSWLDFGVSGLLF